MTESVTQFEVYGKTSRKSTITSLAVNNRRDWVLYIDGFGIHLLYMGVAAQVFFTSGGTPGASGRSNEL